MFNFDRFDKADPHTIYLCRPDDTVICELNGIDVDTILLTKNLIDQDNLKFDYIRYVDGIESNGYHQISNNMKLVVNGEGIFTIKSPITIFDDGIEKKSITAYSCENELEDKDLLNMKINTGEEESLENHVYYDDDEEEVLKDPYTDLPYDYIVFYNTFPQQLQTYINKYPDGTYTSEEAISDLTTIATLIPRLKRKIDGDGKLHEYITFINDTTVSIQNLNDRIYELIEFYIKYRNQLSLLDILLDKCSNTWSVGYVDPDIANIRLQFDIQYTNVYAFLTTTLAEPAKCVFDFDTFNRKINVYLAENVGKDSGVSIDRRNFLTRIELNTTNENIITRYNVNGKDKLSIDYVNFGSSRITNIDYFLNARDDYNKRIYVTDELADKYEVYKKDIEKAREKYIEYSREYNKTILDVNELMYKLPDDIVSNDWSDFRKEEQEYVLKAYKNLMTTLIYLFKNDYGDDVYDDDGNIDESIIKNTFYWEDYFIYKQVIDQLTISLSTGQYTDITDEELLAIINAYKTEWSLYGIVELENKIKAYDVQLDVLKEALYFDENGYPIAWDDLSESRRTEYGFFKENYNYDIYIEILQNKNDATDYMNGLISKKEEIEKVGEEVNLKRSELVNLVSVEGYNRTKLSEKVDIEDPQNNIVFTPDEIKAINVLSIDANYSNENILTTSLNDVVSEVDVQLDLLKDAQEELSKSSQPQLAIQASIENFMSLKEFENYEFKVGNYILLEMYDDYYIKLRLSSIAYNPICPNGVLDIKFTNYSISNSERSDLSVLLGNASSDYYTGGSAGGTGSSNGEYGSIDSDIRLSNIMLTKLLETETFGTHVTDVVLNTLELKKITAKYAEFDGLAKGTTLIDGKAIKTGYIIDNSYDGRNGEIDNDHGSVINLETGKFSFAGGSMKWDGQKLSVDGNITAKTLSAGGKIAENQDGLYIDSLGNLYSGNGNKTKILSDGTFDFGNGALVFNGEKLGLIGDVNATTLSTGRKTSASLTDENGNPYLADGIFINEKGDLYAGNNNQVIIYGDGSFDFGNGGILYNGKSTLKIDGDVIARTFSTGGKTGPYVASGGLHIDETGNVYAGPNNSVYIGSSGVFNFGDSMNYINWDGSTLHIAGNEGGIDFTECDYINSIVTKITQNTNFIKLMVQKLASEDDIYLDNIESYINIIPEEIASIAKHESTNVFIDEVIEKLEESGVTPEDIDPNDKEALKDYYLNNLILDVRNSKASLLVMPGQISSTVMESVEQTYIKTLEEDLGYDMQNGKLVATDDNVMKVVTTMQSTITQLPDNILLSVETNYINDIEEQLGDKVDSDSIISSINMSPESIVISASKLEFDADDITINADQIYFDGTADGRCRISGDGSIWCDGITSLGMDCIGGLSFSGIGWGDGWEGGIVFGSGYIYTDSSGTTTMRGIYADSFDFTDGNSIYTTVRGKIGFTNDIYIGGNSLRGDVRGSASDMVWGGSDGVYIDGQLYGATTSDEYLKDLYEIDERYIDFFNRINPLAYQYKDGHRMHVGFGARSIENALGESGLTNEDFAGLVIGEQGYALRYDEFIALNTFMIKRNMSEVELLKKEIEDLRDELRKVKQ